MTRKQPIVPRSEDPMSVGLDGLEGRSRPDRSGRTATSRRGHEGPLPTSYGFPERPADIPERVWRLTEHWLACGEQAGMRRAASPWYFGKELTATIKASRPIHQLIADFGGALVEDLIRRMVELFWQDYVDSGNTRSQVLNLFLDDYWETLLAHAKTQYTTELIQHDLVAGTLKVRSGQALRSLLQDEAYQAALQDLRTRAKLQAQSGDDSEQLPRANKNLDELLQRLRHVKETSNPEASSEAASGRVIGRGGRRRGNTGGDPRHP